MKKFDIEAIYTAKINEYITNGYTVNAATMRGSLGEIAKIDLRKGNEIIRVRLSNFSDYNRETRHDHEGVTLTVGRLTLNTPKRRHINPFYDMDYIFDSHFEIIERREFMQLNRDEDFFTEDVDEYYAMQDVQDKRRELRGDNRWRPNETELGEAAKALAVKYIKRTQHKSRVSLKDIKVTKKEWKDETHYYIRYFSNEYRLA